MSVIFSQGKPLHGGPQQDPWDSLAKHTSIRDGLFSNATVGGLLTANLRKASLLTDALVNSKDLQDLAGAQYCGNPKFINLPLEIEGYEGYEASFLSD